MATCKDNLHVREKLVELLESINAYAEENLGFDKARGGELIDFHGAEYIADHLIANNVTVQEWIPVTERLPEPFETVCVYDATAKETAAAYLTIHCEWVGVCMSHKITHWMQLPQPPKGE